MLYNILEFLEHSAALHPHKTAVVDEYKSCNYEELLDYSCRIGSALSYRIKKSSPIIVYMEKGVDTICSFFGILYAGGFYALLNPELPKPRLEHIQSVLQSKFVITNKQLKASAKEVFPNAEIIVVESLKDAVIDKKSLEKIRKNTVDTDPLYINFTSGSTGIPKGIVVSHRSVIDFIDYFTDIFHITDKDIIANQAPFDFDVSVKDIYSALKVSATLVLVPRRMFSAPTELIDFLCKYKITTMIWAVSALCLISTFHGLDYKVPTTVNKVLFSGEVMPYKHLCCWKNHLPEALYVNLYGPTEITCNCTYHILDKSRDYSDGIPIGKPFPNEDVFLLTDENSLIQKIGIIGEICVRGSALALGYYRNFEQSRANFVQNPLNHRYPEIIYRTGDLAKYDKNRDIIFCGRKDFQIKYMGHRIELEEIERAMDAIEGVERCCCIFDEKKSRLKGYYVGNIEREKLTMIMKKSLPIFMIPGFLRKIESMPLTKNGKIDRKKLEEMVGEKKNCTVQ